MAVAEMTEKQINEFEMPEIREGAPVRWYQFGTADRNAILGFVLRVKARSVVIWTTRGLTYENVRHISDPKLKLNRDQREDGAWDYSDDYKLNQEVAALQKLVKKLDAPRVAAFEKTIEDQGKLIQDLQGKVKLQAQQIDSLVAKMAELAPK